MGQEAVDESSFPINSGQETTDDTGVEVDNPIGLTEYLRVAAVLVFVILLLYIVLRIIRKVAGSRVGVDNDLIHIVSTKVLKGTTAMHLIEVGNQVFLVGATDNSINGIAEITDQESKDMIKLNLSVDNEETKTFAQMLGDQLKKLNITGHSGIKADPDIVTNRDKLKKF